VAPAGPNDDQRGSNIFADVPEAVHGAVWNAHEISWTASPRLAVHDEFVVARKDIKRFVLAWMAVGRGPCARRGPNLHHGEHPTGPIRPGPKSQQIAEQMEGVCPSRSS
jgi:hypothetical protein